MRALSTLAAPSLAALLAAAAATVPAPLLAQDAQRSRPTAPPLPPPMPDARDVPYPGTITLDIDATDTARGLFRVTQTFPVPAEARAAGDFILLQPKWLPGNHSPSGPIALLADIRFEVDGRAVTWTRDPVAVNAFHVALPAGATSVTARFVHTSPLKRDQGRITMTPQMLNLQWEKMSLYPAGYYVRRLTVQPTVAVPAGWTVFGALDGMRQDGGRTAWAATDYETLVDSPLFAGVHARRVDLGQGVAMDMLGDEPANLTLAEPNLATYRKLVDEALATFGARHFDHYDFLLAMTDRLGDVGLEHHRSSENSYEPTSLSDWDAMGWDRNVIPHEFVHSWNGKFRRPADLWTPDYQQPMQNSLLWVYEGQTQFWGMILAARSGIQTKDTVLGMLANSAALFSQGEPGRAWRPVLDTTNAPTINSRKPLPFESLTRSEDYYTEGALVWLEADQIIRAGTRGRKGLDDFARGFFGIRDGDWGEVTYTFDDVVAALQRVYPYDWAGFLRTRIYQPGQPAPLRGIEQGGYRLAWKATPNPYAKGRDTGRKELSLTYSLGLVVDRDGAQAGDVKTTLWNGPAFLAGIVPGTKIVAVNGAAYSEAALLAAIAATKDARTPLTLLLKRGEAYRTVTLDYHEGLRFPWLEPVGKGPAGLDRLLAPRTGGRR